MNKLYLILILFCFALISCEQEPQNYDDCILKYLKADMNQRAVNAVIYSCRNKFAESEESDNTNQVEFQLNQGQLAKLTGRAGLGYGKYYSGTIYNGNDNIVLNEVEISITITNGNDVVTRKYVDDVSIEPNSTGDFGFDIIVGEEGSNYSWAITGAIGRSF